MKQYCLNIRHTLYKLEVPKVMAIVNVTPDSFAKACRTLHPNEVSQCVEQALAEGADMIDIGGMSTRPGSADVSLEEEWRRVQIGIRAARQVDDSVIVSVDTYRAEVARRAIEEGADIINDISGGNLDAEMWSVIAHARVPYILMHMRGTPATMSGETHYDHLLSEVMGYFQQRVDGLRKLGVKDVIIDPGYGFAKTLEQNYELIRPESLQTMSSMLDLPILVGVSRKSMIYRLLDTTPEGALNGTTALHMAALLGGAHILRVHDVREAVETVKIFRSLKV